MTKAPHPERLAYLAKVAERVFGGPVDEIELQHHIIESILTEFMKLNDFIVALTPEGLQILLDSHAETRSDYEDAASMDIVVAYVRDLHASTQRYQDSLRARDAEELASTTQHED